MLYAVKGNKQLKIDEAEKDTYLKLGYDIAEPEDNELKVIETAPSKTVPYSKYQALLEENAALKAAGTDPATDGTKAKLAEAQKEIKELKAQLAEAKKAADGS